MTTVFPETPLKQLGGRSPVQAARAGNSEAALRATLLIHQVSEEIPDDEIDWSALRSRLSIPPEPSIDPETVDLDSLPLGRLRWCR